MTRLGACGTSVLQRRLARARPAHATNPVGPVQFSQIRNRSLHGTAGPLLRSRRRTLGSFATHVCHALNADSDDPGPEPLGSDVDAEGGQSFGDARIDGPSASFGDVSRRAARARGADTSPSVDEMTDALRVIQDAQAEREKVAGDASLEDLAEDEELDELDLDALIEREGADPGVCTRQAPPSATEHEHCCNADNRRAVRHVHCGGAT